MSDYDTEVLVVGGGPAGVGAAIASARSGAETMLVESTGCLGGMWTIGLQNHFIPFHDHRKVIVRGIPLEITKRLHAVGAGEDPEEKFRDDFTRWWTCFEPESLKWVLDEMVAEAGVRLLLHADCVGAITDGDTVTGALIESKSGRQTISAKIVIDCSGDADVAHFAGAKTFKGREDGKMQPATLAFMMMNVDYERLITEVYAEGGRERIDRREQEARDRGELDVPHRISLGTYTSVPGVTYHNTTRILDVDATNVEDLTRAEIIGRRQVRQIVKFYRENVPGFEDAHLLATGSTIGLRETRRIHGEYELTKDDVLQARKFDDGIACCAYYIDLHNPEGKGTEQGTGSKDYPPDGTWHHVPYRCLVPKRIENLLVAGRCVSASREALGAIRCTVTCTAMGQAVGTAAALSIAHQCNPRHVPIPMLRKRLIEGDVYLEDRSESARF